MHKLLGTIAAISTGLATTTRALEPPVPAAPPTESAPATPQAPSEQAKAPSGTDASHRAPAADASAQIKLKPEDDEAAAQLKRFKAAGYKPEMHDGSIVFCRHETQIGSRFEKKVCTTAHLLERQMAQAKEGVSNLQRQIRPPMIN